MIWQFIEETNTNTLLIVTICKNFPSILPTCMSNRLNIILNFIFL